MMAPIPATAQPVPYHATRAASYASDLECAVLALPNGAARFVGVEGIRVAEIHDVLRVLEDYIGPAVGAEEAHLRLTLGEARRTLYARYSVLRRDDGLVSFNSFEAMALSALLIHVGQLAQEAVQ